MEKSCTPWEFFFQIPPPPTGEVIIEVFARKSSELPSCYSLKLFFPHMKIVSWIHQKFRYSGLYKKKIMILTYYTIQEASNFCQIPSVYPRKDPLIITKVFRKFQIFYSSGGYIKLFQKIIGIDPCLCSALRIAGRTKKTQFWKF